MAYTIEPHHGKPALLVVSPCSYSKVNIRELTVVSKGAAAIVCVDGFRFLEPKQVSG
jgi:hypothetical protein